MADRIIVHDVRKTMQFRGMFEWTSYSTLKTSFHPYAFHNKRFQTVFIDQLVRSKATCRFHPPITTNHPIQGPTTMSKDDKFEDSFLSIVQLTVL